MVVSSSSCLHVVLFGDHSEQDLGEVTFGEFWEDLSGTWLLDEWLLHHLLFHWLESWVLSKHLWLWGQPLVVVEEGLTAEDWLLQLVDVLVAVLELLGGLHHLGWLVGGGSLLEFLGNNWSSNGSCVLLLNSKQLFESLVKFSN